VSETGGYHAKNKTMMTSNASLFPSSCRAVKYNIDFGELHNENERKRNPKVIIERKKNDDYNASNFLILIHNIY
jgi:hypothetical protein